MTGLSAAQLLELGEAGEQRDAVGRARLLLAAACPDRTEDALDSASLAESSARILELRTATFGETLPARVTCPGCGQALAVAIPAEELPGRGWDKAPVVVRVAVGDETAEVREPDVQALADTARCPDVDSAREALVAACVLSASRAGAPVAAGDLSDETIREAGDALVAASPGAEMRVDMTCAGCGSEWAPILDISQFLWREIESTSVQLLDEIHELATGYGWTEAESLALSSRRRRTYVKRLHDA